MEKIKKENIVDYLRALMLTIILPVFLPGNVNAQQLSVAEKSVSSLGAENAAMKSLKWLPEEYGILNKLGGNGSSKIPGD